MSTRKTSNMYERKNQTVAVIVAIITLVLGVFTIQTVQAQTSTLNLDLSQFTSYSTTNPASLPSPPVTFSGVGFYQAPTIPGVTIQAGRNNPVNPLSQILVQDGSRVRSFQGAAATSPPGAGLTAADWKTEIFIEPDVVFGTAPLKIGDLEAISWNGEKFSSFNGDNDWYASIWATDGTNFYLINFEPRYDGGPFPPGTFAYSTKGAARIRAHNPVFGGVVGRTEFNPPAGSTIGLAELAAGSVTWPANANCTGAACTRDYSVYEIVAISFALGSSWASALDASLGDIQIELKSGASITADFATPPPATTSGTTGSGPRAPEISPITYTGDLQSTTSFQLIDGTRVSYNGTTGIIIVVFPNGSSRTVGFPGRITDNQDGTLNVFDETGDAFVDRVIITGRGGEIVTSAPQQTTNTGGAQVRDVTGCTVTTQNIMNLRAEPSVSSADLDDVAFATPLGVSQVATVAGDLNSPWYRVTYNGQTGWLAGPFVETSGTC